jgi:CBS domain-containing protein
MQLSELLVDAWVALPLESSDLGGALGELLARVASAGLVDEARAVKMARDLSFGSQGDVVGVGVGVVAVLAILERVEALAVTVGVASEPFAVTAEGRGEPGQARAVILVLTPGRLTGVRQDLIPVLTRVFRDPERTARLLKSRTVQEIREFREFMEAEFQPRLLVEDALVPVKYRVYPDTPLAEVVDLMVRRGIHAVPVVGERYEVLGILTSGDALEYVLRQGAWGGEQAPRKEKGGRSARDFMTRTVLCVSEGQALTEAANMMVNRDVEQIPVVREGELVGFVTRDSILRALRGALDPVTDENRERDFDA